MKHLCVALLLFASAIFTVNAAEPAKFQVEINYRPTARLHTHFSSYFPGTCNDGGAMASIRGLYEINKRITVGIGFGVSGENSNTTDFCNLPLYGIVEWHPTMHVKPLYVFGELGYGLGKWNETPTSFGFADLDEDGNEIEGSSHLYEGYLHGGLQSGFYGSLGVGYRLQLRRHFGLDFQMGYMLRRFNNAYCDVFNIKEYGNPWMPDGFYSYKTSLTTGSLFLTIGLAF